jgi:hypothetical protein
VFCSATASQVDSKPPVSGHPELKTDTTTDAGGPPVVPNLAINTDAFEIPDTLFV